jgi:hypothetical protein
LEGGAIKVFWSKDGAKHIMKNLENEGWSFEKKPSLKWDIYNYKSPNGKEGITFREFWNSDDIVRNAWYEPQMTVQFSKWNGIKLDDIGKEVKFILPNK